MRIHILSALVGITATLLAVAVFWPNVVSTTHAQNEAVLSLDPEWNDVTYGGDSLPIEEALSDALGITESVWRWRSLEKAWDSWRKGARDFLNSLGGLARGDVLWVRTSGSGAWTQIGAAQEPVAGPSGPAGLNCWDLDGAGEFHPAEDQDGDGEPTAGDCRGPQGEPGQDGDSPNVFVTTALTDVVEVINIQGPSSMAGKAAIASCPPNSVVVGGGYHASSGNQTVNVWSSRPSGTAGWLAQAAPSNENFTLTAYALCATRGFVLGGLP